jgi:hypothetical protein
MAARSGFGNKPYDQFVREILLAEGSTHRDGPAVIYRDRREPPTSRPCSASFSSAPGSNVPAAIIIRTKNGVRTTFYEFAAFFGPVKQKGRACLPRSGGSETFRFEPRGKVKHPSRARSCPRALRRPAPVHCRDTDPRRALADWLTAPDNPFWRPRRGQPHLAAFFGRGLVETGGRLPAFPTRA